MATDHNFQKRIDSWNGFGLAAPRGEAGEPDPLLASDESNGYVEYLHESDVVDAVARAKRENPGALIHLEPHGSDIWSLQVYRSEAAKEVFRFHFFYQHLALASLSRRRNGGHAKNT